MWFDTAYHHDHALQYPPLKLGETRKRKIAGVTVIQRHDWTELRYREIKAQLQGKEVDYSRGRDTTILEWTP